MTTPNFLYHYTSINSLALILANRTFRFTALNSVNDIIEGQTKDMGNLGMYMFASCWTYQEDEHLPLWNMYTPNMRGVRIKLPFPIFRTYEYQDGKKSFIPEDQWIGDNYMIMPQIEQVRKIIYTDDPKLLNPNIIVDMGNGYLGLHLNELGRHKSTIWQFEQEWRFYLVVSPKPKTDKHGDKFSIEENSKLIDEKKLDFTYYDLAPDPDCFNRMEITLGPKIQPGDKEVVESLISKFNPVTKLQTSKLTGKIR